MLIKILNSIFILLMFTALTFAQTVAVNTFGVTDRQVAVSTDDIFDVAYNGLTNVGTGTKVYLNGNSSAGDAANGQWFIVSLPPGSAAAFVNKLDVDANNQITSITLDLAGKYIFQFSNGVLFDEITFNASTYLGYNTNVINCNLCHSGSGIVDKWKETKHATTLERGLKGLLSPSFKASCVRCHSTGYDANASNDGFDDRDFVFPAELSETGYNQALSNSPEAMKLANVQCEACHGPGQGHVSAFGETDDSKIVISISQETCAKCHDSGTHHVFPSQWDVSAHAQLADPGHSGQTRAGCIQCHSGSGFVTYIKSGKVTPKVNEAEKSNITCATCHDLMMQQTLIS